MVQVLRPSNFQQKVKSTDVKLGTMWFNLITEIDWKKDLPLYFIYNDIKDITRYGDVIVRGDEKYIVGMVPVK